MPNENECFNSKISSVQKQFLCGVPLNNFDWKNLFNDLTWENQHVLIDKTVNSNLVLKYPIKYSYQKGFLKFIIDQLLNKGSEINDSVYDAFGRIVALPNNQSNNYKHYLNLNCEIISLKENANIISEGTTGLCTWQASLVLSEWCLLNKNIFCDKTVLELGSGVGLAGIAIAVNCCPAKIYLTDCHESVLEVLGENVLLNSRRGECINNGLWEYNTNGCIVHVVKLAWEKVDEEILKQFGKIDVVICADVVYDKDLFEPLINAFCSFLKINTKIFLACTERNKKTLEEFLDNLVRNCIDYEELKPPLQNNFIWDTTTPIRLFGLKQQ